MAGFRLDKKDLERELRLLRDGAYWAERAVIINFVRRLQLAVTADDFMQLQLKLIGRVRAREQFASEAKQDIESLQQEIAALARGNPKPKERIQEVQQALARRKHQREVSDALRWILISIGDALAWKVLRYDRGAITVLANGKRVSRFAAADGFNAEIEQMEALVSDDTVVLHNDLTTCLRHGDLTAVNLGTRQVDIYEVKLTEQLTNDAPQVKRIREAVTLINDGALEATADDEPRRNLHRLALPYRTHLSNLRDLVLKARRDGYASARVGQCFFVEVLRYDATPNNDEFFAAQRARRGGRNTWLSSRDNTVAWIWTIKRVRDRRYSFGGLAPQALLPLDPDDVADILMGFMDTVVTLDNDCLQAALERQGLTGVEIARPPEHETVFLRARKRFGDRELTIQPDPQLREQMLNELMTPANVAAAVDGLANVLIARSSEAGYLEEQHVVALSGEQRVWEPR